MTSPDQSVESRLQQKMTSPDQSVESRLQKMTSSDQSVESRLQKMTSSDQSVESRLQKMTSSDQSVESRLQQKMTSSDQSVESRLQKMTSSEPTSSVSIKEEPEDHLEIDQSQKTWQPSSTVTVKQEPEDSYTTRRPGSRKRSAPSYHQYDDSDSEEEEKVFRSDARERAAKRNSTWADPFSRRDPPYKDRSTAPGQDNREVQLRVGLILDPGLKTYSRRHALKIQKIKVRFGGDESGLISELRRAFPMVRDMPFDLCTVDSVNNIRVIRQRPWTTQTLRMLNENKRSAVYILPTANDALDEIIEKAIGNPHKSSGNAEDGEMESEESESEEEMEREDGVISDVVLCRYCRKQIPSRRMDAHMVSCVPSTKVEIRVGLILYPGLKTYSHQHALRVQKLYVKMRDESALISELRKAFPIIGDKPFDLCTVDSLRNIRVINQKPWTVEGLKMLNENKRSAVYILPKVEITFSDQVKLESESEAGEEQQESEEKDSDLMKKKQSDLQTPSKKLLSSHGGSLLTGDQVDPQLKLSGLIREALLSTSQSMEGLLELPGGDHAHRDHAHRDHALAHEPHSRPPLFPPDRPWEAQRACGGTAGTAEQGAAGSGGVGGPGGASPSSTPSLTAAAEAAAGSSASWSSAVQRARGRGRARGKSTPGAGRARQHRTQLLLERQDHMVQALRDINRSIVNLTHSVERVCSELLLARSNNTNPNPSTNLNPNHNPSTNTNPGPEQQHHHQHHPQHQPQPKPQPQP